MKISCIVIDDEPLARKGLSEYIADVDFLSLSGIYENALKASAEMEAINPQLIFLDIQMPKISGLEFFRSLKKPPPVILTTAFPQFALEGFELNALDYLVKPFSFERFYRAALKAKEYYELREHNRHLENTGVSDYFFIKTDNKLVKIFFSDINFVEAVQNYVSIHTTTKKYLAYLTFRSIEEYLPSDIFLKTHKSFLISINKIDSIEGNEIHIGQERLPISRSLKDEVMMKLLDKRFIKR